MLFVNKNIVPPAFHLESLIATIAGIPTRPALALIVPSRICAYAPGAARPAFADACRTRSSGGTALAGMVV
jgi:hypothetical protein